ncbi:MAG: hypothetical protein ACRYG7_04240 [Janthinobacterium lividum]
MPPAISSSSPAAGANSGGHSSSLWLLFGGALTGVLVVAHQLQLQPDLSRQLATQQPAAITAPVPTRVAHRMPTQPASIASAPSSFISAL